uniref:DUF4795 domain-containing protein n=1 Tax=Anopheles maculatus TaxID=74869 RepID=A0A182SSV7_9DIPT
MALRESPTCSELLTEAFGAPEPGDLKFTPLQQLLQAILAKLNLEDVPFDQVQSFLPQTDTSSVQTDTSPASELTTHPVGEASVLAPEQQICEPVIRFEDTAAYQELLSNITNFQNTVEDLKQQLGEQTKINKAILPTVEQLDRFSRSRDSSLHSTADTPLDYLSLAARLDKIDESIGKLTSMANDTVLEYSRLEKSVLPYLGGGELAVMRAQLDNINQLLKANFPGFRAHCSSVSLLKTAATFSMDSAVPIDFYQHPVPSSIKSLVPRRSTIKCLPEQDLEKELDTIRNLLASVIARLPLPELEVSSEDSPTVSCRSLEVSADTIRAIWPREFEELLRSCNERIEALEKSLEEQAKQSDTIAGKCAHCVQATEDLEIMFANFRQTVTAELQDLNQDLKNKLDVLVERVDMEQIETETHFDLLDQQMEDRVEYKHFQTRLSKDQFTKTIEQLETNINAQIDHFSTLIQRIESRLKILHTDIQTKPDKCKLDRLESKMRNRFNFFHLVIDNLRHTLRKNVEAAGTKIQLGAEPLRCVSCNHDATMRQLQDVIPTGTALRRCAEKQHKQRIKQLNELVSRIAPGSAANKFTTSLLKDPKQGSTVKAKMVQPDELAYVVHDE